MLLLLLGDAALLDPGRSAYIDTRWRPFYIDVLLFFFSLSRDRASVV